MARNETREQPFFLTLAAQGKEAWNAWRIKNPMVRVNFSGTDFDEPPYDKINFAGFDFGPGANFSACKWRGDAKVEKFEWDGALGFEEGCANFTGATFGDESDFTTAKFGAGARFTGASFGIRADFAGAEFGVEADFTGARFDATADFVGATFFGYPGLSSVKFAGAIFTDRADFRGAIFGDDPSFHNCVFGAITDFDCATLGLRANFSHARFGSVSFAGASFGGGTSFYNVTFARSAIFLGMSRSDWVSHLEERLSNGHLNLKDALEPKLHERHARSWGENQICPDRFGSIAFTGAHFGESDFSGRTFTQIVLFSNATFHRVPSFRAISQARQIDFAGASISFVSPYRPRWTFRSAVAVQLRALRKLAEETKNHDLERDLYFEEKEAERGIYLYQHLKGRPKPLRVISHLIWIIVMYLYWVVADYGRSFML
jgi:uncharacterized protein YjbI with pentapeptide repeats